MKKITPYKHQVEISKQGSQILKEKGFIYLCMEERTGKTLTSLLIASECNFKNILIVTKKKVLAEWLKWIEEYFKTNLDKDNKVSFNLINYESLHTLKARDFDLVILDECHHALSGYPKPSKTYKLLKKYTQKTRIICLSATPSSQTYSQLYHQLSLSIYQPFFKYSNFYEWFKDYGTPIIKMLGARTIKLYDNITNKEAIEEIKKDFFINYTRKELKFKEEPKDILHYIDMPVEYHDMWNTAREKKYIFLSSNIADVKKDTSILLENISKEMNILHQMEGGAIREDKNFYFLDNLPKINYIKEKWGDSKDIAIFYHFISEGNLLQQHFKHALILQGTAFAEGIDLSHLKTCIIYSMNYSASKYTQRRARMCNIKRTEPIEVNYLISKGFLSEYIYNLIANKHKSFTLSYYKNI